MIYFPVSPVAPPNKITFDFETKHIRKESRTLSNGMSKSCKGYFPKHFNLLHHYCFKLLNYKNYIVIK